jgi:hypothetical protein
MTCCFINLKDLTHDLYDYPHTNALFATFTTVSVNKYGC